MQQIRAIVFIDGQNLFHGAREAWATKPAGSVYGYPSYDVEKLTSSLVLATPGQVLSQIRFYTGVPSRQDNLFWHNFWSNKLRYLRNRGVYVFRGRINPGGQEKGVDVSIAIDLIRLTYEQAYEAAIIVSCDSDFGPAVKLAKEIAKNQGKYLSFQSAFPREEGRYENRGVPGTRWLYITKSLYDTCIDPKDYRMR